MNEMINLINALQAWGSPGFESTLKDEIQALDAASLPLQQGIAQSSHVSGEAFTPVIISTQVMRDKVLVKSGIFYSGIIAGSCCADDPTPVASHHEYCVVQMQVDLATGEAQVQLVDQ